MGVVAPGEKKKEKKEEEEEEERNLAQYVVPCPRKQ